MAAFDKTKVVAAAQKYVAQGKIPAAIQEYQKIIAQEPGDLSTLKTIGDLYLQINNNDDAVKVYYKLGDAYLETGFAKNAIAVYRLILRVDPNAIDAIVKLAEVYTIQGQLRDARNQYQLATDYYSKRNQVDKCVDMMEKTLLLDPENVNIKQRLALMYEQTNRKDEAAGLFLAVAEAFADRGSAGDAEKMLKRARELGLVSADVLVLQARIQMEDDRPKDAIATLEQLSEANITKAALNQMFHAYNAVGNTERATAAARRLLEEHDDVAGMALICDRLLEAGQHAQALDNYKQLAARLIAQRNTSPLVEGLKKILKALPSNVEALMLLRQVYQETEQTAEIGEVNEQLGNAYANQGEYAKARELFEELARREPENPHHRESIQQMDAKLGRAPAPAPPPAMAVFDQEATPSAVVVEQPLSEEEQELLNTAITESDLYMTYHQIEHQVDKAIRPLEAILPRLPRNIVLNQHLLELYERGEKFEKAAHCCEVLNEIYVLAGDAEKATQYSGLLLKYQERAGAAPSAPAAPPAPPFQIPKVDVRAPEVVVPPSTEAAGVRELDLSDWEQMMATSAEAPPAPPPAQAPSAPPVGTPDMNAGVEEIEFYLQAGLISEATTTLSRLQEHYPGAAELERLAEKVAMASMGTPAAAEQQREPAAGGSVTEFQFGEAEAPTEPLPPAPPKPAPGKAQPPAAPPKPAPKRPVQEPEFVLPMEEQGAATDDSFELALDEEPTSAKSRAGPPAAKAPPPPPSPPQAAGGFDSLVGALEDELADVAKPKKGGPAPPKPGARPPSAGTPAPPQSGGALADVFDEFKAGMEEAGAEGDIETHFNMGVAFKEMHLFDEAIGEFQKAFQAAERSKNFTNFVQCCTLLAHCFMEKGEPRLAVRWLENALKAPSLGPEDVMALRYEIGSAHELAGNQKAALESFMEVYALNIDYRDVADRIRQLKEK